MSPFCLENLLYYHQSCWYNFENYINYCLAGFSLKQKSEHVSYIFKPVCKRVVVEINYCSLGIVLEFKKGFWASGTACRQGKYKVKGVLAYNILLTVL